ncbi:MAG: hypothetical protein Q8O84_01375 [Nanoarchaeota archaeon]|nr:hypothetical protein [Nanoarchaeota archaeon]
MQKKELLFLILGIFLISFAGAQSSLNLGNIFDSSLIIYGGAFIIFFAFINFLLGKSVFKGDESKTTRAVISFAISAMAVYGLSTGEFLSGFGTGYVGNFFVGDILPTILTIIFIAGIVFFIWKWGLSNVLMVFGALSIIISLTDLAYEKNVFFVLGIIFLVIGLLLKFRKPKISAIPLPKTSNWTWPWKTSPPLYEQRKRGIYDLSQKYEAYKMSIFRTNLSPHQRKSMLRAMYLIRNQLRKLGASQPGQSPEQIESTLRNNRLI